MQVNRISYTNQYTRPNYNNHKIQQNTYTTANNLIFEGLNFKKFKPQFQSKAEKLYIQNFLDETSNFLGLDTREVQKYVTPNKRNKMEFFRGLATKVRNEYFSKKEFSLDKRIKDVENLYNTVKKPTNTHLSIIKDDNYSFDESAQLLRLVEEKPENLHLYSQITGLKNINDYRLKMPAKTLISILSSENSAKLNEHFDDFSSYIILNHKNANFLEDLSTKLSSETTPLNSKEIDKLLELEQRKTNSYFLHIINNKDLLECDNELGMKLFYNKRGTAPYLRKGTDELSKKDVDFYKYVISTTDKTNFNARNAFFENYCIRALDENGNTRDDIKRLFMRMDEDKHLRKTFELLSAYGHGIAKEPIDKLLYYIDSFGTKEVYKKLDRFIKIADVNLAHDKKPEEIVEAISKNLNNKYYQTSGMKKQEADKEMLAGYELFFPKTKVAILKLKNKMKYSIMPKIFGTGTPAPINKNATYRKPLEEILTAVPQPIIPQPTPTIKRDFKAKKLQIQQDAQEIIKSRMKSAKQIEEQIGDYTKKSTKMRNQFLNEMFNSVAETRAQQRAQGIKRPTISNADVLEVYQKINGKNKKLFKYLLNSRKENGEREFDLKQIGSILDEVKKKRPQKINPSEK